MYHYNLFNYYKQILRFPNNYNTLPIHYIIFWSVKTILNFSISMSKKSTNFPVIFFKCALNVSWQISVQIVVTRYVLPNYYRILLTITIFELPFANLQRLVTDVFVLHQGYLEWHRRYGAVRGALHGVFWFSDHDLKIYS